MTIKIDGLYALVGLDINNKPTVHAKIYTDKNEAEEAAKILGMTIKSVLIQINRVSKPIYRGGNLLKLIIMTCPKCGSHDYYFDGLCDVCLSCGHWQR